jgi:hypothetical protein
MIKAVIPEVVHEPFHEPAHEPLLRIREIRLHLNTELGYSVPESTLKRWKRTLGIRAENGKYTIADRDLLMSIGRWFRMGGKLQDFHEWQAQLQK